MHPIRRLLSRIGSGLVVGNGEQPLTWFTVTDEQNIMGLEEGDVVTFTPNIAEGAPGRSGESEQP